MMTNFHEICVNKEKNKKSIYHIIDKNSLNFHKQREKWSKTQGSWNIVLRKKKKKSNIEQENILFDNDFHQLWSVIFRFHDVT